MIWIIILIFVFYFGLSLYFRKFNSPYIMTALFGRIGAGKTTLMIKYMIKYKKKGWNIYTDLKGIKIPGVKVFDVRMLEHCSPPPHSAVFLDEIGLSADNRQYKTFPPGLRDWYALHRHYKIRVFYNSQVMDMDKKIRDRTQEFLFLQKVFGCVTLVRPIIQKITPNDMSNPNCDSPISQTYKWDSIFRWRFVWIPKYVKYFDSFDAPARPNVLFAEVPGSDLVQDIKASKSLLAFLNRKNRRTR